MAPIEGVRLEKLENSVFETHSNVHVHVRGRLIKNED